MPRLTGPFVVSIDSAVCSSTITERRHEHRAAADPVAGLLRRWIALRRVGSSEAHRGRALVVVAGSASPLGGVGPQHLIYNGRLYLAVLCLAWPRGERIRSSRFYPGALRLTRDPGAGWSGTLARRRLQSSNNSRETLEQFKMAGAFRAGIQAIRAKTLEVNAWKELHHWVAAVYGHEARAPRTP